MARELEKGPLGPVKVGTQRRIISSFFSPPPLVLAITAGKVLIEGEGGRFLSKGCIKKEGLQCAVSGWGGLADTCRYLPSS